MTTRKTADLTGALDSTLGNYKSSSTSSTSTSNPSMAAIGDLAQNSYSGIKIELCQFDGDLDAFPVWKMRFSSIMNASGLPGIGDLDIIRTDTQMNAKLYNLLILSLGDNAIGTILDIKPNKGVDAFKALVKKYERNTSANKRQILRQLFNCHMHDQGMQGNVEIFIDKVKSLLRKLTTIGVTVSDDWIIAVLMNGLTDDYTAAVAALDLTENLTVEMTISRILDHAERIEIKEVEDRKPEMLMGYKAKFNPNPHFKKQNASDVTCFKCKEKGHYRNQCPRNKTESAKEASMANDEVVSSSFTW